MVLTRDICEEIKSAVNIAVSNTIKNETLIAEISEKVSEAVFNLFEQKILKLENTVAQITENSKHYENKIQELENKILTDEKIIHNLEEKTDQMDQRSRIHNLRIFNFGEKLNENTPDEIAQFLNAKMPVSITGGDIQVCYRVGKKQEGKTRGIFIKFKDIGLRESIYNKKKFLKGTGVVVREDLTSNRLELLQAAIEKVGLKNAWSDNGKIYVAVNSKVHLIKKKVDILNKLTI